MISQSTSNIGPQRAVLHAILNPENETTHYYFEYGPTTEYGYDTPELELSSAQFGEWPAQGRGRGTGEQHRIPLPGCREELRWDRPRARCDIQIRLSTPPVVSTGGASSPSPLAATLEGLDFHQRPSDQLRVRGDDQPGSFGPPTGLGSVGAGFNEAQATLALHGLEAKTTYYYKLVGTNADGTDEGEVHQFTTAAYPPDQISVQVLPILTEPFVEWPAGGAFVNSATEKATKRAKNRAWKTRQAQEREGRTRQEEGQKEIGP